MSNAATQIHDQLRVGDAAFTKQIKGGGNWDELIGLEDQIRHQIANSSVLCWNSFVVVTQEGVDDAEFHAMTTGIMRDLQNFADNLNAMIKRRNGRKGMTLGPDEYTDYIAIGLELSSISENFQVVVGHSLVGLVEFTNEAHELIKAREDAEKAKEDAVDPTVVTDVEVKVAE